MAFARVQSAANHVDASSSVTVTLSTDPTVNNLLVAVFGTQNSLLTVSSLPDVGWVTQEDTAVGAAGKPRCVIAYKVAAGTEGTTFTFTFSGSGDLFAVVGEWSGGATSSVVDQSNSQNSGSSTVTSYATGNITTLNNEDLLIAGVSWVDANLDQTLSIDGSFTIVEQTVGAGSIIVSGGLAERFVSSTGTYGPTWSHAGTADEAAAGIVSFKSLTVADTSVSPASVSVGLAVPNVPASLSIPVSVRTVRVKTYINTGFSHIDLLYIPVPVSLDEAFPLAAQQVIVHTVPVAVGVVPTGFGTAPVSDTLKVVSPVGVSVSGMAPGAVWYETITIVEYEVGYFARDTTEPVLAFVYGLNRSLPVGWSSGEGWQIVSERFVFNDTTTGRGVVDRAVSGAWASDRLSSQTVLKAALDGALQGAGFRKPGGGDIV